MDIDASLWMSAAGPSRLELTVLDWFNEWIGYPLESAGELVSDGSARLDALMGAIDPLPELAEICHECGMWVHVDGAYGGFSALTERGRRSRAGIELADLGPGQFLGELVTLNWGAGSGYVRTATVVARQDLRPLVLAAALLDEPVRAVPSVERQIRAALRERPQRG